MDALDLLLNRVSCARLQSPAPTREQRDVLFAAAARAADHGSLQPWRFLEIEGDGLSRLGKLFVDAALAEDPRLTTAETARLAQKPQRAPLIVVAIARHSVHPKVPEWEQTIAAGCAVQNLINAAFAQGIGAYWRTGSMTGKPAVYNGLGLSAEEKLIGFIYLGNCELPERQPRRIDPQNFVSIWPAN